MTRNRLLLAGYLLLSVGILFSATIGAGDNLDFEANGQIRDAFWYSRLFDGTPGYQGTIRWFHNPAGKPGSVNQAEFEARIETGFNTWEAVDDGLPEEPLVPVASFGGQTSVTDAFALDGVNAVAWKAEAPGGTLAVTPCWVLTEPTATIDNGAGQAALPVEGGGSIPFPGPIGVTYPAGTMIDCGMRFDSLDNWSTSAIPGASSFDVQSVATHEIGHFIGLSHSTLGDFAGANPMSATMLPFAAPGDDTFRTLEEDDRASALRTYARNRQGIPIPQTVGNRAVIRLTLLKGLACEPASGVSIVAYRTQGGLNGPGRVEMFSGSQLRAGIGDEPAPGTVSLNVPPLAPGDSYTIYARTLEQGTGALSSQRYNYTTINSNLIDPAGQSRTFDQLATIPAAAAGESIDLGAVGILNCSPPDPSSPINLVATAATAPVNGFRGSELAVTSSFINQGTAAAGPFQAGIYFSTDATITASDIFSGFACTISALQASATANCDGLVAVPSAVLPGDYYVGVLVDRQNQVFENVESDNGLSSGHLTAIAPNPLDPFVNGSFESGDLTGWTVKELTPASNPSLPLSVHGAGVEYPAAQFIAWPYIVDFFTSQPTDGQFAALHDFNGDDPTTAANLYVNRRELYQDVALPPGTTTLEFDYRAAWELFRFGSTRDRTFSVEIEPAGGGATLLNQTVLVVPNMTIEEDTDNPTGGVGDYPPGNVDLSAFANQSVRVKFVWNVPEPGTGFAFFQLDNIRLNTLPNATPVVDITAPADGSTVAAGQTVTFIATAIDAEDGDISASVLWSSSIDGDLGTGATLSTSSLSVGTHMITATVVDTASRQGSDSMALVVNAGTPNSAPVVTITAPDDGATFTAGRLASFAGTAVDSEDGTITANLAWSSSLDGPLGTGGLVSTSALRGGRHTITASVTDSSGQPASASIVVNVNVDNLATADFSTSRGSITGGSFQSTWADDGVYESLSEAISGGNPSKRRSQLEHTWTFNVTPGSQYVFKVNAYRAGTEDAFMFSYSRNNLTFTPMGTVSQSTDGLQQTFVISGDVSGTLYIRVQDTDSTAGNIQLDSLFVDFLAVTTVATGGGGGTNVTLLAAGRKIKGVQYVDLAWTEAATASVSITRNGVSLGSAVPNTGAYTDSIGSKGSGTYEYQVCEVGGSGACSNIASVTF
jgi:hypothetical protein